MGELLLLFSGKDKKWSKLPSRLFREKVARLRFEPMPYTCLLVRGWSHQPLPDGGRGGGGGGGVNDSSEWQFNLS